MIEDAIRQALAVYQEPSFVAWADAWLDGTDRTAASATVAEQKAQSIGDNCSWKAQALKRAAWQAAAAARLGIG